MSDNDKLASGAPRSAIARETRKQRMIREAATLSTPAVLYEIN